MQPRFAHKGKPWSIEARDGDVAVNLHGDSEITDCLMQYMVSGQECLHPLEAIFMTIENNRYESNQGKFTYADC